MFLPVFVSILLLLCPLHLKSQQYADEGILMIGLLCSNLEESLYFYKNIIGMKDAGGFHINEEFGKKSGLSGGTPFDVKQLKLVSGEHATVLKLASFKDMPKRSNPSVIQSAPGVQYLTFFVHDLTAIMGKLAEHQIPVNGQLQLDSGEHLITVQDPDGVFIELVGHLE